jgi:hypothetical protein
MLSCIEQRTGACASCPWIKSKDQSFCSPPDNLRSSVVAAIQDGDIHECHSAPAFMCAGFLSFAEKNYGGARNLAMVRIRESQGLLDCSQIDVSLNVFSSIEQMLEDHELRMIGIDQ